LPYFLPKAAQNLAHSSTAQEMGYYSVSWFYATPFTTSGGNVQCSGEMKIHILLQKNINKHIKEQSKWGKVK